MISTTSPKFYESIHPCVITENYHNIPFLLNARWLGVPVPSNKHLCVQHPCATNNVLIVPKLLATSFHDVIWDDVDDSESAPCRKARLRLGGKRDGKDIFALFSFDMHKEGGGRDNGVFAVSFRLRWQTQVRWLGGGHGVLQSHAKGCIIGW